MDEASRLLHEELGLVQDKRVRDHIESLLVTPRQEARAWDYGPPNQTLSCWIFLEHETSDSAIAHSQQGFGPQRPWGLVELAGEGTLPSMGMDSGWFGAFMDAYFESLAAAELPIWRVFKGVSGRYPGEPITDEGDWETTWAAVERLREMDRGTRYDCHHSIVYGELD